jgi:hypothetical protein
VRALVSRGVFVIAAALLSAMMFGTGVAAADDFAGLTYGKANEIIGQLKSNVVVAGAVGDRLSRDDCIVTRSQRNSKNDVILFLNCSGDVATATGSGPSSASPAGQKAKETHAIADYVNADPANCQISKDMIKACKDFCDLHADLCVAGSS